jgi:serine/threonine protein kinase
VAIKIIRKNIAFLNQGKQEIRLLNLIKSFHFEKKTNFIVQMNEDFMHKGHLCIVFELLSNSLLDLINLTLDPNVSHNGPGLSLRMVHKFTHQLLCALATLRTLQIIHCDLKPENVALVNPNRAHIKLLDFGSACQPWENVCNQYPYIQSRFYRAPEILLGTRYSYPIDMWSLGCVLVELFTARPLFAGRDSVEQLYKIMEVLGPPPQHLLEQAAYVKKYFVRKNNNEYVIRGNYVLKERSLRQIIMSKSGTEEKTHLENFLDLVQRMLVYDPAQRITPTDALQHPFILYGPARITKTTTSPNVALTNTNTITNTATNNNNNNQINS